MLKRIQIKSYRNIKALDIDLSNNINLIIAPNGSGKTNFLESIFFTIFSESFRTFEKIEDIFDEGEGFVKVQLEWDISNIEFLATRTGYVINKKHSLNSKRVFASSLISKFPIVVFAPNSVDLVSREPSVRRKDLDDFLRIVSSDYKNALQTYKATLKNRNALIKMIQAGRAKPKELHFWTEKLVESAFKIYKGRLNFFEEINNYVKEVIEKVSMYSEEKRILECRAEYLPNIQSDLENFKIDLLNKYLENQEKEIVVGKTLYGVHKDDFVMYLNGKNLRFLSSRGQQRIGTFLFKISQINYYERIFGKKPLFLIDDLMSELDDTNRRIVAQYLIDLNMQFILTSAEKKEIPERLLKLGNAISLVVK